MTGIIGAGFGLYGYLPAVVQTEGKVVLLEESKEIFQSRPELQIYKDNIQWITNMNEFLSIVIKLIVCVPPKIQEGYFDNIIANTNISNVVFEKPIASTPKLSREIISRLLDTNKTFRIGYTFLYTDWFTNFDIKSVNANDIKISWAFKAHHYKHDIENWKRNNSDGGGVIRFFGIHLFPLLVIFGFTKVISSETQGATDDDLQSWNAVFENKDKFRCCINVNSNSDEEHFNIKSDEVELINFVSPFETVNDSIQNEDNRVSILKNLLTSLSNQNENNKMFTLYEQANDLWMQTESTNNFRIK